MHSEGISYKPRDGEVGVCPQQQTREMLGVVPGWVQQATRRKTAREPSTRRAPQKRRSEVRTMSHKVIFWGQGTTRAPWRREAKNGQRSSCSPAATRRVNSGGWPAGDLDALRNEDRELLFDRAPAH